MRTPRLVAFMGDAGYAYSWDLDLDDGDLLVMRGRSQDDYLHSLPKTTAEVGARINLTFRRVVSGMVAGTSEPSTIIR